MADEQISRNNNTTSVPCANSMHLIWKKEKHLAGKIETHQRVLNSSPTIKISSFIHVSFKSAYTLAYSMPFNILIL